MTRMFLFNGIENESYSARSYMVIASLLRTS